MIAHVVKVGYALIDLGGPKMSVYRLKRAALKDRYGLPLSGQDQLKLDLMHMSALSSAAAMYADDPLVRKSSALGQRAANQTIKAYVKKGKDAFGGYGAMVDSMSSADMPAKFGDRRPKYVSDVID